MTQLSIVIPAKNEENRIRKTLQTYGAFFLSNKFSENLAVEIIVVVNNSDDKTSTIVDELSIKFPQIKKLETPYASGKGGAVSLGFSKASGDYIGFVDADGAVPPSEVYKLYTLLSDTPNLDGIIGKRSQSKSIISAQRRFLKFLYNFFVRALFGLPYKDTQCGAKIFTKTAAKSIGTKLSNTGWTFDVNLLLLAKYLNLNIAEKTVNWSEKAGSQFSLYVGLVKVPHELIALKMLEISTSIQNTVAKVLSNKEEINIYDKKGLRILFFAWRDVKHPEMGGSEVYVHEIAKRLAKQNNVTLFTSKPGNLSSFDSIDGVKIIRKGGRFTVYLWGALYYIFKFRGKFDLLVDVENGIPFFTPFYSFIPKILVIHHVHKSQWFKEFNPVFAIVGFILERFLMPLTYRNSSVITVSPSSLKEIKELGFSDKKIFIAYNSIPQKIGKEVERRDTPLLLYVGRIKHYKRLEIAIASVYALKDKYPELNLYIAGAGEHVDKLREHVSKLKISDRVKFLGFISEKQKWHLMQKAWVFLMPSMKEGWGITIMEAASCGTPTVGYDVPGVRDSVKHNLTGLLAHDFDEYVRYVDVLISNKKIRNQMEKNCVSWAKKFSWETSTEVFEHVIDSSLSKDSLLKDIVHPWDLDINTEYITSIMEESPKEEYNS